MLMLSQGFVMVYFSTTYCRWIYKEWFYPTSEIGHKLPCITNIFGLCHAFYTQHGVIQQSSMRAGVIQVFYILFHGLSKITLVVPFQMFHINFGYLFSIISFVDKILLINRINRIHCKCLEQIDTFCVI